MNSTVPVNSEKLTTIVLISWIALLGADRVDLSGGILPFNLSPFLFITLILIFKLFISDSQELLINHSHNYHKKILFIYGILIITIIPSLFFSQYAPLSLKRFILLNFEFFSIYFIASKLMEFKNRNQIFLYGSMLGLALFFIFSIFESIRWFSGDQNLLSNFINLTIVPFGPFAPRLSGLSNDPNRACLVLTTFFFLFLLILKNSLAKHILLIIASILIFLSLSKSGVLLFLSSIFYYLSINFNRSELNRLLLILFISILSSLLILHYIDGVNFFPSEMERSFLSERFSAAPGSSAEIHLKLLQRALELAINSPESFFIGNGFQNSQNLLEDYFPQNKYANFHSLYASLLIESGFFSLIACIFFLTYPIFSRSSLRPLLVGLILFNIFYQSILDPVFWFIYILGYMSVDDRKIFN